MQVKGLRQHSSQPQSFERIESHSALVGRDRGDPGGVGARRPRAARPQQASLRLDQVGQKAFESPRRAPPVQRVDRPLRHRSHASVSPGLEAGTNWLADRTRPRPARLASYRAASAAFSKASTPATEALIAAHPMLTPTLPTARASRQDSRREATQCPQEPSGRSVRR